MKRALALAVLAATLITVAPASAALRVGFILEYKLANGSHVQVILAPEEGEGFIRLRDCRERLTRWTSRFRQQAERTHPELTKAQFVRASCDTFNPE